MIIRRLVVGPLENNCYVIADERTKESIVVDPGDEPDRIIESINEGGFHVNYIICTHAHFDHVGAVSDIKKETGAQIIIHRDELEIYHNTREQAALWGFEIDMLPEPDLFVSEGETVKVGSLEFRILHTPGHSPGGICLLGNGILLSGDTVFAGSVGRTDLHGGNIEALRNSFKRLMSLSDRTRVLPGHGPESTIGQERTANFFSFEIR